jgi:hypothetical protein
MKKHILGKPSTSSDSAVDYLFCLTHLLHPRYLFTHAAPQNNHCQTTMSANAYFQSSEA